MSALVAFLPVSTGVPIISLGKGVPRLLVLRADPKFSAESLRSRSSFSSPLLCASATASLRCFGTADWNLVIILALFSNCPQSPCSKNIPASAFNALLAFGCTNKQAIVTNTSLKVNLTSQSLFNVSTQTAPVLSSTFGWKILSRKYAFGGS